jgi:hypothetical protein
MLFVLIIFNLCPQKNKKLYFASRATRCFLRASGFGVAFFDDETGRWLYMADGPKDEHTIRRNTMPAGVL